jgi:hypothetical protein
MSVPFSLRTAVKRGALIVAANWQVVAIQFIAESSFKLLLAVPVLGGALLVALLLGGDLMAMASGELRQSLALISGELLAQPVALLAFLLAFGIVLVGGSTLTFLIKGGTVSVLAAGERDSDGIEVPPLRLAFVRRAAKYTIEAFLAGAGHLFRRYLRLGFALLAAYAVSGTLYLFVIVAGYELFEEGGLVIGWTFVAALISTGLVAWITLVNFLYLLMQMIVALEDVGTRQAARHMGRFLRSRIREVGLVFAALLVLVVLATAASILATAGLGLISFVPFVGLAVIPLQVIAWLVRGLVFQYLGLTALATYMTLYRSFREASAEPAIPSTGPWVRTA